MGGFSWNLGKTFTLVLGTGWHWYCSLTVVLQNWMFCDSVSIYAASSQAIINKVIQTILVLLDHITRTTYVDVLCCYWPSSVVCHSICRSVCLSPEKNGCTNRDAVWVEDLGGPRELCISWGSRSPHEKGQFGGKGAPIVKYRDTLRSPVRKQLNQSWCRLDCGLRLAQGIMN